jgi:hypothetical protein
LLFIDPATFSQENNVKEIIQKLATHRVRRVMQMLITGDELSFSKVEVEVLKALVKREDLTRQGYNYCIHKSHLKKLELPWNLK